MSGEPSDDGCTLAGSAYVFRRAQTGRKVSWRQKAYLKGSREGYAWFGSAVSLSGNTLTVGAPGEPGCNEADAVGGESNQDCPDAGAVYVHRIKP